MKKLVIIGGMGNGTVIASTVEDAKARGGDYEVTGFLNDLETGHINGYQILGKVDYPTVKALLRDKDVYFIWTLFSTKLNFKFLPRLIALQIPLDRFATVIHPTASISGTAKIGRGVSIQPFVNIGPNVTIGNHVHIFALGMVGHNTVVDDYSYIANNAGIGARIRLRKGAYIGTNCSLLEGTTIGKWALVGMGAVVLKDVPPYTKVVGNPARIIGRVK